ncbi:MAG: CBS domain-containing protein [Acidobacteriota bacterium]
MYERKDKWSVGQWMSSNPLTVPPETSVRSAFYRMRVEGYRHLLVVAEDELLGIVTDRDLRRPDVSGDPDGWNEFYQLDEGTEVRHVMTGKVESLSPHDGLEKALKVFIAHKFGAMPVLDKKGEVIGILTTHDLLTGFQSALDAVGGLLRLQDAP